MRKRDGDGKRWWEKEKFRWSRKKRIMGKGKKRRKRVDGVVDLQGRGVNVIK